MEVSNAFRFLKLNHMKPYKPAFGLMHMHYCHFCASSITGFSDLALRLQ